MSYNLHFDLGKIIGWILSKVHPVFDKSEAKKKGVKTRNQNFYLLFKLIMLLMLIIYQKKIENNVKKTV